MVSQATFNPLPAVVIGGPPYSGKSVLTYSLTQALRARGVEHYVLRAYPPDYEGDWFLACDQKWVRHLRLKGARSQEWVPLVQRDIARRHLPLIVDMGGLPTPEQEAILDGCTHGILLTPDESSRQEWAARFARHGLVLLADLRSDLRGQDRVAQLSPLLCGTIAGLERGQMAAGPTFTALVENLAALFRPFTADLRRHHLEQAPVELTIDLDRLAQHFHQDPCAWNPAVLPDVLDYLPTGVPLGLYGRGPNWLYAAVAAATYPAEFVLFDVRLGWVSPPLLQLGLPHADSPLHVRVQQQANVTYLDFTLPDAYLDITEIDAPIVPPVTTSGLTLSGKLPQWLWTALARTYHPQWLAVFQPQLYGAVVVATQTADVLPGMVMFSPILSKTHPKT